MRALATRLAFNRGLMSSKGLARVDLKRTSLAAELQTNWLPRTLGSMSLRPGLGFLGNLGGASVLLPFIFSVDDTALVQLSANTMRVWQGDTLVSYPVVATAITNGGFATDLTGWTDIDEAGTTSSWQAGALKLVGNGTNYAGVRQLVAVDSPDMGIEHAIQIVVSSGEAVVSMGSTSGGSEYFGPVTLRPGQHSLSITPTDDFYIQITARTVSPTLVDSVTVHAGGALILDTPFSSSDIDNVRYEQSGDVIFVADGAHRQKRIERQGNRSWSIVDYVTTAGPFRGLNTTTTTLTSSVLTGAGTLTASKPLFTAGNVGSLYRLESSGQRVSTTVTGGGQWTDSIRVTGVSNTRAFTVTVAGKTDASVITLQRSIGDVGDWAPVQTYAANTTVAYNDGLDNQIVYYRLGVDTGDWVSDDFTVSLTYAAGTSTGVARVTGFTSPTSVSIDVVKALGATEATPTWWEGRWSDRRGWPSAVAIHDGRLWWAGKDHIDGSVSDAYASFDDTVEGDSGPIGRTLGSGPVDDVNWLLPLTQLLVGTEGSEMSARASQLDEPLTPSAFSLKAFSTQGSARVGAVRIDNGGIFVQRNGRRLYEASVKDGSYNYGSADLTAAVPDIGRPGVRRLAVQRQPDTRVHVVRTDGTVALLVYDRAEEVNCWVEYETDGMVTEVAILPGVAEDLGYYVVKRTIDGVDQYYLEKWASEDDCFGGPRNLLADSFVEVAGPVTTVTGLDHLEGKIVVAWGNGKDLGTFTVTAGEITLPEEATTVTVGLGYDAWFKSSRIGVIEAAPYAQPKQITHLGLLLEHTHAQGLRYGQSFDYMDDLPLIERGAEVGLDTVHAAYEEQSVEVNGSWETDARLCLHAAAPRPCTILAAVADTTGHAK